MDPAGKERVLMGPFHHLCAAVGSWRLAHALSTPPEFTKPRPKGISSFTYSVFITRTELLLIMELYICDFIPVPYVSSSALPQSFPRSRSLAARNTLSMSSLHGSNDNISYSVIVKACASQYAYKGVADVRGCHS